MQHCSGGETKALLAECLRVFIRNQNTPPFILSFFLSLFLTTAAAEKRKALLAERAAARRRTQRTVRLLVLASLRVSSAALLSDTQKRLRGLRVGVFLLVFCFVFFCLVGVLLRAHARRFNHCFRLPLSSLLNIHSCLSPLLYFPFLSLPGRCVVACPRASAAQRPLLAFAFVTNTPSCLSVTLLSVARSVRCCVPTRVGGATMMLWLCAQSSAASLSAAATDGLYYTPYQDVGSATALVFSICVLFCFSS
jgi:hypothetical protein